jgi:hypothetical protein
MKAKKKTPTEMLRAKADEAMPEVKRLVKKYGRNVVARCVNSLREYEKRVRALETAKQEVERLEKEVGR